eukprot:831163_1
MGSQNNFSISTKVYPAQFQDWSKKIDFENGKDIGYLCDDGEVIRGNVLAKDNKRIFVKFNCRNAYRSYGQLEDWINIPNERICPPPKIQITNYIPTNMFNDIFNPNIWTTDIPTSRHDQDEDLQRAIAESLGQIYNINNSLESNHQEIFQAQKEVCYEEAVNLLLNGECCFGLYDKKIKKWRTAVFLNKWGNKGRIMIRYTQEVSIEASNGMDKFCTIKNWPVDYISTDYTKF